MSNETDSDDEGSTGHPRLADYKGRTWKLDQESRRHLLLEEQKRRREDAYNAFRDFSDVFNDDEDWEEESWHQTGDKSSDKQEKPIYPKLKDLFMLSEWMTGLPEDFHDMWTFVPCPVGTRCLVRSCKGSTTVYGKRGYRMAKFKSALPNGGHHNRMGAKCSKSDVTVLDCIWSSLTQSYFILDVLYWKGQSYLDTDVGFRSFWIRSKMEEVPLLNEKSKKNPYPFILLNYYACDLGTMSSVMSRYPLFESDAPQVDGILFYHREGYYTPGVTPLVLWLKPYMLAEVFGCDVFVAEEYFNTRPASYTNMLEFISEYEERRKGKPKRRRWKKGGGEEAMELVAEEVADEEESEEMVC